MSLEPHTPSSAPGDPPCLGLVDVPNEVAVLVFQALPVTGRAALLQTCTHLKNVHESSAQLQYDLALARAGYIDVPHRNACDLGDAAPLVPKPTAPASETLVHWQQLPVEGLVIGPPLKPAMAVAPWQNDTSSGPETRPRGQGDHLSPADKTTLLRGREERWASLLPAETRLVHAEIRGDRNGVENFVAWDGLLQHQMDLLARTPAQNSGLCLRPLPSSSDPDLRCPSATTRFLALRERTIVMLVDLSLDLVVVRPMGQGSMDQLHLLAASTLEPHPLAAVPVLQCSRLYGEGTRVLPLHVKVMGNTLVAQYNTIAVVGLNMRPGGKNIVAWNWKTGQFLGRIQRTCPEPPRTRPLAMPFAFILLTPTTILLANSTEPSRPYNLQIWSFLATPGRDNVGDHLPHAICVAQLELPLLRAPTKATGFIGTLDPDIHGGGSVPIPGRQKPFTRNIGKGVIRLRLAMDRRGDVAYDLHILRERLVDMANAGDKRLAEAYNLHLRNNGASPGNGKWAHELDGDDTRSGGPRDGQCAVHIGDSVSPESKASVCRRYDWAQWSPGITRMENRHCGDARPGLSIDKVIVYPAHAPCGYRDGRLVGAHIVSVPPDTLNDFVSAPLATLVNVVSVPPEIVYDLVVRDYNPATVAREAAYRAQAGMDPSAERKVSPGVYVKLDYATTVPAGDDFAEPVCTTLPFYQVRRELPCLPPVHGYGIPKLMLDDERVIFGASPNNAWRNAWGNSWPNWANSNTDAFSQSMMVMCM